MATITLYQQQRRDGGRRFGLEIDQETVLGRYLPGPSDSDSALEWFVDVECSGDALPTDPDGARAWLLQHSPSICKALIALSTEFEVGMDASEWPVRRQVADAPSGTQVYVACSATRRIDARQLANVLRNVAREWEANLKSLAGLQAA
ncbi:MAG: hypothetical protein WBD40_21695 [Tepidisphaeraceae bacterium]